MNYLVFAIAAAAGIALIMIGILSGRTAGQKVLREDENGYLRPVSANESTALPPCWQTFPTRSGRLMEILKHV